MVNMHTPSERSSDIVLAGDRTPVARTAETRSLVRNEWLLSKRSRTTREAYLSDIRQFFAWVDEWSEQLGTGDVFGLHRAHIDAYREYMIGSKLAPASVARKLTTLSSFYGYAVAEHPELLAANPVARVARPEVSDESQTASLTLDEARRLLSAARTAGAMEHALIGLLITTGLRISEVVDADSTDLGRERGHTVISVTRKGGRRAKLPVPAEVAQALSDHLGGRVGPLFVGSRHGLRIRRQHVDRVLARLTERAGVPGVSPHGLRHTAATVALDGGQSLRAVQQMLGHRDPRTTNRYDRSRTNVDQSAVHAVAAALGASA